jgi:hypothetical protein
MAGPIEGRAAGARRRLVDVYHHQDARVEQFEWELEEMLAAIRQRRPRRRRDGDWTFCVGDRPDYLAISTDGPRAFSGQHPLWGVDGRFEGAMLFHDLTLDDVAGILGRFFAGRRPEGCFAPYRGTFKFYQPGSEDWASTRG